MNTAWKDERNCLDVDTIEAELQVGTDIHEDCSHMLKRLLKEKKLLQAASKGLKYKGPVAN